MVAFTVEAVPRWNPINVCSYHLQEAGATPVQEIAFAFANAIAVLDAVRDRPDLPADVLPRVVGRISFFLNAGIRFVEEICKGRAMAELWDEITRDRYGVDDPKQRRFRYGVQVNSLGLTEAQPENNVIRIVLEALGVTFSKKARCRAPADPRLRDRPPRVRRPVRRLRGRRGPGHGAPAGGARRARPRAGDGRSRRGGRERVHEAAAGGVEHCARPRHRVR
jgi:hypothetical protein